VLQIGRQTSHGWKRATVDGSSMMHAEWRRMPTVAFTTTNDPRCAVGYKLRRKLGQAVIIGGHTTVTVADIGNGIVGLLFDAPDDVSLERAEAPRTLQMTLPRTPLGSRMRPRAAG